MKKRLLCALLAMLLLLCACLVSCDKEKDHKENENNDPPKQQNQTQLPFVPPAFEENAVQGMHTVQEGEMGYGVLDARGVYKVGVCGQVNMVDGKAYVWFTNPAENNVWLKLRVINKQTGAVLGETGLLKPGEYVSNVTFSTVPEKGTPVVLRVMSYEPETYYSKGEVTLNTSIS